MEILRAFQVLRMTILLFSLSGEAVSRSWKYFAKANVIKVRDQSQGGGRLP
jgi:hypothetical protein